MSKKKKFRKMKDYEHNLHKIYHPKVKKPKIKTFDDLLLEKMKRIRQGVLELGSKDKALKRNIMLL